MKRKTLSFNVTRRCVAVALLANALASSGANAAVVGLDFQGPDSPALFVGQGALGTAADSLWNAAGVADNSPGPYVWNDLSDAKGVITAVDVTLDSLQGPGSFSLFRGTLSSGDTNSLNQDYVHDGGFGGFRLVISDLAPNAPYNIAMYGGRGGATPVDFTIGTTTASITGDLSGLAGAFNEGDSHALFTGVQSDATGSITVDVTRGGLALFTGMQIEGQFTSGVSPMELVVDRTTGEITLGNPAANSANFDIVGYSILSAAGTLSPAGWTSIAATGDADSGGAVDSDDVWITLADSAFEIGEATLGTTTIAPGQTLSLGAIWQKSLAEDVRIELLLSDGESFADVSVRYEGNGGNPFAFADLNFDGAIDAIDWREHFRPNVGEDLGGLSAAEAYQRGDLNADGVSNGVDFGLFREAFIDANGAAAFAALMSGTAVPETATAFLACLGVTMFSVTRRQRRHALSGSRRAGRRLGCFWPLALAALAASAVEGHAAVIGFDFQGVDSGVTYGSNGVLGTPSDVVWNGIGFTDGGNALPLSFPNVLDGRGNPTGASLVVGKVGGGQIYRGQQGSGDTNDLNSDYIHNGDVGVVQMTLQGLIPNSPYTVVMYGGRGSVTPANFRIGETEQGITGDLTGLAGGFSEGASHTTFAGVQADAAGTLVVDAFRSGLVLFTGMQIEGAIPAPPVALQLQVDRNSGEVTLKNTNADFGYAINYYEVLSPGGSLNPGGIAGDFNQDGRVDGRDLLLAQRDNPALIPVWEAEFGASGGGVGGWSSLQDQNLPGFPAGDGNGGGWEELGRPRAQFLGEGNLTSDSVLAGSTELSLGKAYDPAVDAQDLVFNYRTADGNLHVGEVVYVPAVVAATSAVPEATSALLALVGLGGFFARRRRALHVAWAAVAIVVSGSVADSANAAVTSDRLYRLGEEAGEGGVANGIVGAGNAFNASFDSAGQVGVGNLQDLTEINGGPRYVVPGNSLVSRSTLAVEFDGVNDYLSGLRLGYPATSEPAVAGTDGLAPMDYTGLFARGMQFWVKPHANGDGKLQSVVMDTQQHGVQISSQGTWTMRYGAGTFDSGVDVDFGQWTHVMMVRPTGAGSLLYINGNYVAGSGAIPYDVEDDTPLVVGASTGATPGGDFFAGVIDELDLFVMGNTTTQVAYGRFNIAEDNEYFASVLPTLVRGDVNGDGAVDDLDVDDLVGNWRAVNAKNGTVGGSLDFVASGDLNFDGAVNLLDWGILRAHHPNGPNLNLAALLAARAVPEPSAALVATIMGSALICRRQRTR